MTADGSDGAPASTATGSAWPARPGIGDRSVEPVTIVCHGLDLDRGGDGQVRERPDELDLLDAHERRRALALRFERDRRRYITAHAAVRRILGAHLGLRPAEVPLTRSASGKPMLDLPGSTWHFSLTHSGARGWLALSTVPIGIDAEHRAAPAGLPALIAASCTPVEARRLFDLDADRRVMAFLALWTRKEAALKAWGSGLGEVDPSRLAVGEDRSAIITADGRVPLTATTVSVDDSVVSVAAPHGCEARLRFAAPFGCEARLRFATTDRARD